MINNMISNRQDQASVNKCYVKIYKRIRHDSITDYETINESNISNKELYINTIELTFGDHDILELVAKKIKSIINASLFQIHIYFDEENNNQIIRPLPYRLSNSLLLWCNPPKKIRQLDLSYIGFLSKSAKGWSGSIPHEIKLNHLNKNNNNLYFIAMIGLD